ncbi:MAG: signal peptide peptidase SppA [Chitinophagaceae bacterium]|nr:signal peptide peptidase SppA [Chitinophagaceae bacterium]
MKQFFKFMFASMLGVFLSLILMFFILAGIIGAMISSASSDETTKIESGTVLHVYFRSPIQDRTSDNPFENFDFSSLKSTAQPGLNDILKNIQKASTDPDISGIYLDLSGISGGMAVMEEIRNALLEFKESKKFIIAYADYYTQGAYYIASVSDKIWVNPEGVVDFRGFSSSMPFLKGMLAKLEVEPQVIRHGKFKSAIEPFILDKMSDENKQQVATYVNAFWNHFVTEIAESRKIDAAQLHIIADSILIQSAEDALTYKMVDKIGYKDEFLTDLASRTSKDDIDAIKFVNLNRYTKTKSTTPSKEFTRDKIAVIYASGDIVGGKGSADQIGSDALSETIRKARLDDKVKGVVLRVNSPGGDALASEVIWREALLCKQSKPFIVSMGDVAASGGYYISCMADTIVAQPNTITGSIGVFGLLFNAKDMFNNKLGITFDNYETGPYANTGTITRPLTEGERRVLQNSVERVYDTFTKRVADGRKMSQPDVDSIGQGRVWSGIDALQIGLVDVLGGLDDAIVIAAKKAGITNYRVSELPEQKEPLQQFMEELSGDVETRYLKSRLGSDFELVRYANEIMNWKGIQARLPFSVVIN